MRRTRPRRLPLAPLLEQFRAAPPAASTCPAAAAIASAATDWLTTRFLDTGDDAALAEAAGAFYRATAVIPLHPGVLVHRVQWVRHALNHLLRGQDKLADRLTRCVTAGEPYFLAGLGRSFWAATVKALDPDRIPFWCGVGETGLTRLGLLRPAPAKDGEQFERVARGYETIRATAPDLTATMIDDFLGRVARMTGRELPTGPDATRGIDATRIEDAIRRVRVRTPLRKRLRDADDALIVPHARFQAAARAGDCEAAFAAFREAFPDGRWEHALPQLDDAYSAALPPPDRAWLWCETAGVLGDHFRAHPLELADVVIAAVEPDAPADGPDAGFGGFAADTFRFLGELSTATSKQWLAVRRDRYQFVLREPLVDLCEELAARYVRPVLGGEYGWELEAGAKPGRALTSICKNDFGRSGPYQPVQWVTFYRRDKGGRRADAQFCVRVAADGVGYGFHLGRAARDAGRQFRRNVQDHAEAIHAALAAGGVFDECRFWTADDFAADRPVRTPADLRQWATHKTLGVGKRLAADAPLLRRDELVGEILLTFDRLVPLFACATEADPRPLLSRRAGTADGAPPFDRDAFTRETFLSGTWLDRAVGLLRMKRQLVLQGVPGTGKTHVARCLARLLAHDRPDCVRLVQFHPAYSYEEFVEGVRVRAAEVNGRSEVTYPVEDGVLCAFAEQAARRPSETHVLVIDELNRGNLPRVFGELLYLLEYRDQAVTLPYSKRLFRLPDNLIVLGTMNAADRSAVALDQALRRRFSFVEMPPDAALLACWLDRHPPADPDETFGPRVVRVFEALNRRLARDLGPDKQVGHSFFMIPDLDAAKLSAVWDHHVRPLLLDHLGGLRARLADYEPARLLGERPRRSHAPADPAEG